MSWKRSSANEKPIGLFSSRLKWLRWIRSWCVVESGSLLKSRFKHLRLSSWSFAVWPSDNTGILGTGVLVNTQQTPQTWQQQPLLHRDPLPLWYAHVNSLKETLAGDILQNEVKADFPETFLDFHRLHKHGSSSLQSNPLLLSCMHMAHGSSREEKRHLQQIFCKMKLRTTFPRSPGGGGQGKSTVFFSTFFSAAE